MHVPPAAVREIIGDLNGAMKALEDDTRPGMPLATRSREGGGRGFDGNKKASGGTPDHPPPPTQPNHGPNILRNLFRAKAAEVGGILETSHRTYRGSHNIPFPLPSCP